MNSSAQMKNDHCSREEKVLSLGRCMMRIRHDDGGNIHMDGSTWHVVGSNVNAAAIQKEKLYSEIMRNTTTTIVNNENKRIRV